MANHKRKKSHTPAQQVNPTDKPVTLKDMLGADTIAKLKQQAEMLKQEEVDLREQKRLAVEAARIEQQKLNEKDFEYLLNHSNLDWKKHK
jgi:hypothetical protein